MAHDKQLTWDPEFAAGWGLFGNGKLACYAFAATENFEQPLTPRSGVNENYSVTTDHVIDTESLQDLLRCTSSTSACLDAGYVTGGISAEAEFLKEACRKRDSVHFTVRSKALFEPPLKLGPQPALSEAVTVISNSFA